jgi:acyl carrier protein
MNEAERKKLVRDRIFNTIADSLALEADMPREKITEETEIFCDSNGVEAIWNVMQSYGIQISFHLLTVGELTDMAIEVLEENNVVRRGGITMI